VSAKLNSTKVRDWLTAHQVTHVAMESTGVSWKPVDAVLEDDSTPLLVNAAHLGGCRT
jgi:hypothetical protein